MKAKIKFKAMGYRGELVTITELMEVPDFKVITSREFNGIVLSDIPVEAQIIEWLDNQDKTDFIVRHELALIRDYDVVKPKEQKTGNLWLFISSLDMPEQLKADLAAVHPKVKDKLKGKPCATQLDIMLSYVNIGYEATTEAYKEINRMLKSPVPDDVLKEKAPELYHKRKMLN